MQAAVRIRPRPEAGRADVAASGISLSFSLDRVTEMYRLYVEDSLSLGQVGERFGLTRQRVSQLFQEAHLPARPRVRRGPRPASPARIEEARLALMAADRAAGCPLTEERYRALRARVDPSWPSPERVARVLGGGSWRRALADAGVPSFHEHQRSRADQRRDRIVALWATDRTVSEIADLLGMSPVSLRVQVSKMRKRGYELPERGGSRRPSDAGARLTGDERDRARFTARA
jgi:DNA-binding CsgD family transcriptional regulator